MQSFFGRLVCCTKIDPIDWADGSSVDKWSVLVAAAPQMQTATVAVDSNDRHRTHVSHHDFVLDCIAAFVDRVVVVDSNHVTLDSGISANYSMAAVAVDSDSRIFDLD